MILLSGSTGFIGKSILDRLSKNNSIKSLNRKSGDFHSQLEFEIPTLNQKFSCVIHTAGKAHFVPKTKAEAQLFYDINFIGTINLLKGLENSFLPQSFVFISTIAVYGLTEGIMIKEEAPLLAKDPYGFSKMMAEKYIQEWCLKHSVVCTILRLPLVVGANPPGNLGTMLRGVKKGYYFNIAGGGARKSMVLVSDVANFLLKAAEVGGTYNLTDGYHPNFNELSQNISYQFGKSFVPNMPQFLARVLAKVGDIIGDIFPLNTNKLSKITSTLTFDDSKARVAFGWDPTPVLEGFKIYDND